MTLATPEAASSLSPQSDMRGGVVAALVCYSFWGILPILFRLLDGVPAKQAFAGHHQVDAAAFDFLGFLGVHRCGGGQFTVD